MVRTKLAYLSASLRQAQNLQHLNKQITNTDSQDLDTSEKNRKQQNSPFVHLGIPQAALNLMCSGIPPKETCLGKQSRILTPKQLASKPLEPTRGGGVTVRV